MRRVLLGATAVIIACGLPVATASAAPLDPGDFLITMQSSVGGNDGAPLLECTTNGAPVQLDAFLRTVSRWDGTGATPAGRCTATQVSTLSNSSDSGTVSNEQVGSGAFRQTCDMRRTITSTVTLTAGTSLPRVVTVDVGTHTVSGYIACAWSMSFSDPRSTRLAGTIEQTLSGTNSGKGSCGGVSSDGRAFTYCVDLRSENKVWVVGATGAFAQTTGTGTFAEEYHTPITISAGREAGDVQLRSVSAPNEVRLVLAGAPAEGSADTSQSMKLALVKNSKLSVRMVSPPRVGATRTLGTSAGGTGLTRVKLSAAPGARCGVTATLAQKSASVLPPTSDADGLISTSITSRTLTTKLAARKGARILLTVYCASGRKEVSSRQTVTLGT